MGVAAPTESAGLSPLVVTILIYIVYLILGYFLNGSAMLLMTLPFTYLLMIGIGHDPLWFGVMCDTRHSSDHNNNISPYMYLITYDDEVITFEEKRDDRSDSKVASCKPRMFSYTSGGC